MSKVIGRRVRKDRMLFGVQIHRAYSWDEYTGTIIEVGFGPFIKKFVVKGRK